MFLLNAGRLGVRRCPFWLTIVVLSVFCVRDCPAEVEQPSTPAVTQNVASEGDAPLAENDEAIAVDLPVRSLTLPQDLSRSALSAIVSDELAEALFAEIQVVFNLEADSASRRDAAARLRTMLQEPAAGSIRAAVLRRVNLVDAGLAAAALDGVSEADRERIAAIVAAASRYEDTSFSGEAVQIRELWRELRDNDEIMTRLRPAFMDSCFNYNLHITVSERMLARLVKDYRTEHGSVADCILGAWVTGSQVTTASVTADIRHSTGQSQFLLRLHGHTNTNTRGRKDPATIFTRGNHTFDIQSPVYFDGERLTTGQAQIHVDTNNQTVGASTDFDGIPLLGPLARKIAVREAQKKRAQSEYIAAQKLANRALPEFVREANDRFARANTSIQDDLFKGLELKGVAPDSFSSRSSDTHLAVSTRTIGEARMGGTPQPFGPLPLEGLALQIHETEVNNVLDGLGFAGRSIPEDAFFDELEKSLSELMQRDITLRAAEEDATPLESPEGEPEPPSTFVFHESDPIRMRFEQDRVVLELRTGIIQEGKEPLPMQRAEVPIQVKVVGSRVVFIPPENLRDIQVAALESASSRVKQFVQANQIRRILKARLPQRDIDGVVTLEPEGSDPIDLRTVAVSSQDGWLYIEMQ